LCPFDGVSGEEMVRVGVNFIEILDDGHGLDEIEAVGKDEGGHSLGEGGRTMCGFTFW
jgi:hypothetical protein